MPLWTPYNYGCCTPVTWADSTGMMPDSDKSAPTTIFIDKYSGRTLGELKGFNETANREDFSMPDKNINIRSISADDFENINNGGSTVERQDEHGILHFKYSDPVRVNKEKIASDLK